MPKKKPKSDKYTWGDGDLADIKIPKTPKKKPKKTKNGKDKKKGN